MLRIAVCDDELYFREEIQDLLAQYLKTNGILYKIDTFSSGTELVDLGIEVLKYQIIFLDINMDRMDGLETARKLREVHKDVFIVFVTAFVNYTLEGYKVDAVRYILKNNDSMQEAIVECMDAIRKKAQYAVTWKEFQFNEGKKRLSLDHLLYVESRLHKLEFYVMEDEIKVYTMYETLNRMEEMLQEYFFVRIHQSFLVNMKYIKSIKRYEVLMSNGMRFDIPRARYKAAEEQYVMYKGML